MKTLSAAHFLIMGALLGCTSGLGDDCRSDSTSCAGGLYCCREGKCGGGMCTAGCSTDRDCPSGGFCQSRICFAPCGSDRDCAPFLRCKEKDGRFMCRGD